MREHLDCQVLIVGGGLAGLACAQVLHKSGADWILVEKSRTLGGRIQTRRTESGFLLDRGFQVLNTAYPALARVVDTSELRLGEFSPGADVFAGGKFHRVADPLRSPADAWATVVAPVGGLQDKLNILRLVRFCSNPGNLDSVVNLSTEEFLAHFGFSSGMVQKFFRPFFGGVFLEEELLTSARKFVTLFSYFSRGKAALPADGMQALPQLMASRLPAERIKLGATALELKAGLVETESYSIKTRYLALAGWEAQHRLLGVSPPKTHSANTAYFARPKSSQNGNSYLKLNGSPDGVVQTVAINSAAQPSYAPSHLDLVAVSTRQRADEGSIKRELSDWFGPQAQDWEHLHSDHVRQALPQEFTSFTRIKPQEFGGLRVYCLGDHTETGSIQGALTSGRRAGLAIIGSE